MNPMVVAAGTALVGAVATDAWQQACAAVAGLWRERGPADQGTPVTGGGPVTGADVMVEDDVVTMIMRDLEGLREQVLQARQEHSAATERALAGVWQLRLQALLRRQPERGDELRRVLNEVLAPAVAASFAWRIGAIPRPASPAD